MIERIMNRKALELSEKFQVIAITGPRQSGKTTLARTAFPGKHYCSLEDPGIRRVALEDPKGFLGAHPEGMILDEAQRVPELFSYIQTIVDQTGKSGQFILTGSQNFLLHESISQTLAGRVAILKLLPFSLEETKGTEFDIHKLDELLYTGLYPGMHDRKIPAGDWFPNYIQTYVERDLRSIQNVFDLNLFQKFLRLCSGRVGQLVNFSSLASDCGISHNTAKSWLGLLEQSYLIFFARPYHNNFNKRLIKMPKLFFYDTGLLCALLGIENSAQLETHYLRGSIFESLVVCELLKYRWNRGIGNGLYFFRDKSGREIDCIVEIGGKPIAIEVKSGKTIVPDHLDSIKYWEKISGLNGRSFLIYGGEEKLKLRNTSILGWHDLTDIFTSC
ncbi:MAG: ATP-binding protein [Candidatus Wallbacteria bacterium]|nr:ATP-binding protein [Candidatus Wallbacteria bacterium]